MSKKILYKDVRQSITGSLGRFISIFSLMMLGVFVLVGLKVTGPDMRSTAKDFYNQNNLADLVVTSEWGLNKSDQDLLKETKNVEKLEFGYLKDVIVKGSNKSFRLFSLPNKLSKYEVINGKLPANDKEIALSYLEEGNYKIGDTITFSEVSKTDKKENGDDTADKILNNTEFKVVGFVKSSEIVSKTKIGETTVGTGHLDSYAVVCKDVFDSDVYMIARLSFADTKNLDMYSDEYKELINSHKSELKNSFLSQSNTRLQNMKDEKQIEINDGLNKINDIKNELKDAKNKLDSANNQINSAKSEISKNQAKLNKEVGDAKAKISTGEKQLSDAKKSLNANQNTLNEAEKQLNQASSSLDEKWNQLQDAKKQLITAKETLDKTKETLDESQVSISNGKQQLELGQVNINNVQQDLGKKQEELNNQKTLLQGMIEEYENSKEDPNKLPEELEVMNKKIEELKSQLEKSQIQLDSGYSQLDMKKEELKSQTNLLAGKENKYNEALEQYNKGIDLYNENKSKYYYGLQEWKLGVESLDEKSKEFKDNKEKLALANKELANKEKDLISVKNELKIKESEGQNKINDAKSKLSEKEKEYNTQLKEYNDKKLDAETEIKEKEEDLKDAQYKLDKLKAPKYNVNDRKANPGYKQYLDNSQRIDVLSNIFPVFLFGVAALVTLTTMTRFVDEQRINIGTLKALGYSNKDINKKFIIYGLSSSGLGATVGAILGHIVLPKIIFRAYAATATFSKVNLHFDLKYTVISFAIAILCTVLSTYLVLSRELKEQASNLLLPKPPKVGSRILLERIPFIWNRMSFTYKVTARNIFRYKKRMLMTIFGVAGCTALLITGFGIKNSLSGIVNTQFDELMKYDLTIVENDSLSEGETNELNNMLNSDFVNKSEKVYYESFTIEGDSSHDTQDVKMIVPSNLENFNEYINLRNRKSRESINLDDGAVISEKLSDLLNIKIGDTISIIDDDNNTYDINVTGITEMYMGHYIFMNKNEYKNKFNQDVEFNSYLVQLKDKSTTNIQKRATEFLDLDSIKGVVQTNILSNDINMVMAGLNNVILVLIGCATLLAIVVIYNLTNINVSERIHELSTIKVLGFYHKEVTLYIYRETIFLSIIGILVGYGVGSLLHSFIIGSLPPDESMFNPPLWISNFVLSGAITLLITFTIMFVMHRKIKRVNMLDALKSVD
ncbi:ABC transporter permease [[Clostridium] sordellii]|uniref:FtsX-like permease family protein n=1 Tax=Paraclostridium sordellii TaxID=1505 RepID=UPI0005E406F7|nr:FtsX-like permease family protein [Paeniclostridium sordellii]CEQ10394.1 ABC transporter permease [[Clostridium] sordellii] [Paeniclostridium sordellii]